MKKIYVATKTRGFLSFLINQKNSTFHFYSRKTKVYETNSRLKIFIARIVKSSLADHLGVIQRIVVRDNSYDIAFSYNRFLISNKKYIIYLENPLALVHYSINRPNTLLSKIKLRKYFNDPNLVSIICLSKACYETVNQIYDIPDRIKIEQIYPYIPNSNIDKSMIINKSHTDYLKCLYISSDFKLKGGEDIIVTFEKLKKKGLNNIKLLIVTRVDRLNNESKRVIELNSNIELLDFKLNKEELQSIYEDSNLLLNPTRQDSFSLVTLEAIKNGLVILSTDLYALPEMIEHNINGFLVEPKYRFFNKNNMPNKAVWSDRENTIYSDYIDYNIVNFLFNKIIYIYNNRDILERMAMNSYLSGANGEFGEDYIINKWKSIVKNGGL